MRSVLGVRDSSVPFSYLDDKNGISGFTVDICETIVEAIKADLLLPLGVVGGGAAFEVDRPVGHQREPGRGYHGLLLDLHQHALPGRDPVRLEGRVRARRDRQPQGPHGRDPSAGAGSRISRSASRPAGPAP
jgi:ABC-type amino acid transport substrate-binding protein